MPLSPLPDSQVLHPVAREGIFDVVPSALVVVNASGGIIDANCAFARLHGFESKERLLAAASTYADLFEYRLDANGRPLPFDEWPVSRLLRGETFADVEIHDRSHLTGREWIGAYNGAILRDAGGNAPAFVITGSDITAQKETEHQLLRIRHNLESAQHLANIGSWDNDLIAGKLWWSPETCNIFGTAKGEVLTTDDFFDLVHADDRDRVRENSAAALAGGCEYDIEHRIVRRDGAVRHVHQRARVLFDERQKPIRMIGSIQDITERKLTEQTLQRTNAELARMNEDLKRFAYVASHDLQEPLRMIKGFTELLVRQNEAAFGEDAKVFAAYIISGVSRMQEMINDLLEFSRLTHEGDRALAPTDCNTIVRLALDHLQCGAGVTHCDISVDALPVVMANESRLLQVFQNLISNALKYCEGRPHVHISAVRGNGEWVFSIADNGIGIAPEYHDRIWTVFQRLHPRDKYPGTGIGLAIVKRIIERHHGRVWLTSTPGAGSTFYFTLPAD